MLLLDEPLGALDLKLRKEMQLELKALQREVGITFVYVTHDQEEALTMSDMIVVMRDGRIQQQGGPTELYERPVNHFVAGFIGSSNFLPGTLVGAADGAGRRRSATERGLELSGFVTDREAERPPGPRSPSRSAPSGWRSGRQARRPPRVGGLARGPGTIHQGTYLGDQTEYRIETDQAGELIVRRQNAAGTRWRASARGRATRSSCAGTRRRTSSSSDEAVTVPGSGRRRTTWRRRSEAMLQRWPRPGSSARISWQAAA